MRSRTPQNLGLKGFLEERKHREVTPLALAISKSRWWRVAKVVPPERAIK